MNDFSNFVMGKQGQKSLDVFIERFQLTTTVAIFLQEKNARNEC